jgi:LPS sulfotransferase NodH
MVRYASYVVCTSPRSGSTLLCKLLGATGMAGAPDSHFHEPSLIEWLADHGLARNDFATEHDALTAVVEAARRRGTGGTGIFGLRLQRHSFDFFIRQLGCLHPACATDRDRIQAAFGTTLFIHLSRRNKLEQAISFVKATQTGLWHRAPDGTELERLSPPREPVYDPDAIARQVAQATMQDREWDTWFAGQGIDPLRISYDDLSSDPRTVLALVLDRLGVGFDPVAEITLPVARLADATSRIWAARFRAEQGPEQAPPGA